MRRMQQWMRVLATLMCCAAVSTQQAPRPKVALCFFGLVKNTTDSDIENYRSAMVQPLQRAGYDVEAFLHTYHLSVYGNKRNGEAASGLRTTESLALWRSLVPFRLVEVTPPELADRAFCPIARFFAHGDPWMDNPVVSVVYFLRQQYSLWRVTRSLARFKDEFVGAIYLRPDVKFLDELEIDMFEQVLQDSRRVIAAPTWHNWNGVNDRFAFGRTDEMIIYGERMVKLADYVKFAPPHAERYLRAYLNSSGISIEGLSMRFQRVRTDGSIEHADMKLAVPRKKAEERKIRKKSTFKLFDYFQA